MEIRTITIGSLNPQRDFGTIERLAEAANDLKSKIEGRGITVQSIRYATQVFPRKESPDGTIAMVKELEERAKGLGIPYLSIGTVPPQSDEAAYSLLPKLIRDTQGVFCTVTVGHGESIDDSACLHAAAIVKEVSESSPDGFGNFRFSAIANVPPHSPFLPAAYHEGEPGFSIGCQFVDLLHDAFEGSPKLKEAEEKLMYILTDHLKPIEDLAVAVSKVHRCRYFGIDASVAPAPGGRNSIAYAIERLGVEQFGSPGTLSACAMITRVLQSLPLTLCGYTGLMLPVLEDTGLAERNEEGAFSIDDLLLYSSVCGTGLDTVPPPRQRHRREAPRHHPRHGRALPKASETPLRTPDADSESQGRRPDDLYLPLLREHDGDGVNCLQPGLPRPAASSYKVEDMVKIESALVGKLCESFGMTAECIEQFPDAYLAAVLLLNDAYVLRGRQLTDSAIENLQGEVELLAEVSKLVPFRFPTPQNARSGLPYHIEGNRFWTLYEKLPGKTLGRWNEIVEASDGDTKLVLTTLRKLHDATAGKLDRFRFDHPSHASSLGVKHHVVRKLLPPHANHRIESALEKVQAVEEGIGSEARCFVHGDIHHGNLLVEGRGKVTGILDCDWVRVGHPFEDLAYTVKMCLCTYDADVFHFHEEYYQQLLEWYGLHRDLHSLFAEYLILAVLFDLHLFSEEMDIENQDYYRSYQISMIATLCDRFATREHHAALPSDSPAPGRFPIQLPKHVLAIARELQINPSDIEEHFTRGRGHGGQKVNKTSSTVQLKHIPTSLTIRCQDHREQHSNRIAAYTHLILKLEKQAKRHTATLAHDAFKKRRQTAGRTRAGKEVVLREKKERGELKKQRMRRIV